MNMELAAELLGRETGTGAVLRDGIVTAVSPLTVTIPPSTVASPATALDSCSAVVGDFVQVLVQGANRLVIGVINGNINTFTVVRRGGGSADTLGSGGTNSGRYQLDGAKCYFSITWVFGAGGSGAVANAGVTTFDAPVAFGSSNDSFQAVGSGVGIQAGARFNFEVIRDSSANGFQLYGPAQVTSTVPGAVTFSDAWRFNGWYWTT